ncbi:MAG TPA: hypothetical protein PK760_07505 [Flavobacteriales bacterium]|nr:hypothetical protein [Flavobacteriales bacterium]
MRSIAIPILQCTVVLATATVLRAQAPVLPAPANGTDASTVVMTDLEAVPVESGMVVHWTIPAGSESHTFHVQRSDDLEHWTTFYVIGGGNTGDGLRGFTVHDPSPYEGDTYYRVRHLTADRRSTYSDMVVGYCDDGLDHPVAADDHSAFSDWWVVPVAHVPAANAADHALVGQPRKH